MRKALSSVIMLSHSICCAYNANQEEWNHELISSVLANETNCVLRFTEKKIYLNPGKIYPTAQGMYLNLKNDEFILIPCLISDDEGCYIEPLHLDPSLRNKCPGCGRSQWGSCDNRKCPEYQKQEERKEDYKKHKEERMEEKKNKKN